MTKVGLGFISKERFIYSI